MKIARSAKVQTPRCVYHAHCSRDTDKNVTYPKTEYDKDVCLLRAKTVECVELPPPVRGQERQE